MPYAFQIFHFRCCCIVCFRVRYIHTTKKKVCSFCIFPLFFFIGEKWSKHYLRFLNIRICYLCWDVRGTKCSVRVEHLKWCVLCVCVFISNGFVHVIDSNARKAATAAASRQRRMRYIEMRNKFNEKKNNPEQSGLKEWKTSSLGFVVKYSSHPCSRTLQIIQTICEMGGSFKKKYSKISTIHNSKLTTSFDVAFHTYFMILWMFTECPSICCSF